MKHPVWKFFTSLRLTVACLALAMVLVFAGTLAQVDAGLWNSQQRWFRSFFVWWHHVPVFPGGFTVGGLLLANLIAAHIKRFTWARKKIGIQLTHLGVIVLLLSELSTYLLSRETQFTLGEGETRNYSESQSANELVFATDAGSGEERVVSIPASRLQPGREIAAGDLPVTLKVQRYERNSRVVAHTSAAAAANQLTTALATVAGEFSTPDALVPLAEKALENEGRLPVWRAALRAVGEKQTADVVAAVERVVAEKPRAEKLCRELQARFREQMLAVFSRQSAAMAFASEQIGKGAAVTAAELPPASSQGAGQQASAFPLPEETEMDSRNIPFTVIELQEGGKSRGTWLFSPYLNPQEVTVGGTVWRVALRGEREYHGFSTTLLGVKHDVYPGTRTAENRFQGIPKNFQSRVRLDNPAAGEKREVDIYMNNPLRYSGLTFYQYQMGAGEGTGNSTSTFQVVRNPGWITPYAGCILVALGMLVQFGYHLIGFIVKRNRAAAGPAAPLPPVSAPRPPELARR